MMRPKLRKEGNTERVEPKQDLSPTSVPITENWTPVSQKGKRLVVQELMVPALAWLLVKASWQEVEERQKRRQISKDLHNEAFTVSLSDLELHRRLSVITITV